MDDEGQPITILRLNGNYAGIYRTDQSAKDAARKHAIDNGQITENTEVTWEFDGDPRPGRGQWWMWAGHYATGWTIGHDRLR